MDRNTHVAIKKSDVQSCANRTLYNVSYFITTLELSTTRKWIANKRRTGHFHWNVWIQHFCCTAAVCSQYFVVTPWPAVFVVPRTTASLSCVSSACANDRLQFSLLVLTASGECQHSARNRGRRHTGELRLDITWVDRSLTCSTVFIRPVAVVYGLHRLENFVIEGNAIIEFDHPEISAQPRMEWSNS